MFNAKKIRDLFPMYRLYPHLVYLDNSATALTPQVVLDKMNEYYSQYGVNIHRGVYHLSYKATEEYDKARGRIADFINSDFSELVFTKNASNSLNMMALMYGDKYLQAGDAVITSELEHHSSFLPWMKMCKRKNAELRFIPLNADGRITVDNFRKVFDKKVKVVALTYVSNVLGYITPIKEIIALAHRHNAIVIVDAAQAAAHIKIDVKDLDCDCLAFSAHKMLGPTGIGALYGKKELLLSIDPLEYGGDMNNSVSKTELTIKEIPFCFETGTAAIAEVLGFAQAVELINGIGLKNIGQHCITLHKYALSKLTNLKGLTVYNPKADIPIISFNIDGVHPHDAATFFDESGICLRAGHHCAQLVSKWLECNGTLRASFYIYNDYQDVDRFVETVKETVDFFRKVAGEKNE
ncbi:MAG: cysteine desulfurase [Bacilli bacterium]|nr:cysteine desulfurase [Bacilli bacterium]